jgi:hypothetical protein
LFLFCLAHIPTILYFSWKVWCFCCCSV